MTSRKTMTAAFLMLALATSANAYIVPGQGPNGGPADSNDRNHNDNSRPGQYVPPRNDGGHSYPPAQPYYPPQDNHGGWGRDDRNDHDGWVHDHGGWGGHGDYHHDHGGYYPPVPQPYYPPGNPYYPPTPPPPPPVDPYYPPTSSYTQTVVINIGRAVANERIHLGSYLQGYTGWRITSVHANPIPNSGGTTVVRLAVNQYVVASQTNPGRNLNLLPSDGIIPADGDVELWINGSTSLNTILITVESP